MSKGRNKVNSYRFYKNEAGWFFDLPECIQQVGNVADLEIVDGAIQCCTFCVQWGSKYPHESNSGLVFVGKSRQWLDYK
jgi:hypothetical protein